MFIVACVYGIRYMRETQEEKRLMALHGTSHGATAALKKEWSLSKESVIPLVSISTSCSWFSITATSFFHFFVLAWCLGSSEENNEDGQGSAQRGEGGPHGRLQGNRALHRLPKCSLCTGERLSRVHFSRLKSWHVCSSLTCARLCAD
jgi:hypothetical protein